MKLMPGPTWAWLIILGVASNLRLLRLARLPVVQRHTKCIVHLMKRRTKLGTHVD